MNNYKKKNCISHEDKTNCIIIFSMKINNNTFCEKHFFMFNISIPYFTFICHFYVLVMYELKCAAKWGKDNVLWVNDGLIN